MDTSVIVGTSVTVITWETVIQVNTTDIREADIICAKVIVVAINRRCDTLAALADVRSGTRIAVITRAAVRVVARAPLHQVTFADRTWGDNLSTSSLAHFAVCTRSPVAPVAQDAFNARDRVARLGLVALAVTWEPTPARHGDVSSSGSDATAT